MGTLSPAARLEWGPRGAREAAMRGDIVIIVDVLSFSSTVTTALGFGAIIYLHPGGEDVRLLSERIGASVTVGRAEAVHTGARSLSPLSFTREDREKSYVLCSPNGATCCRQASEAPALLIGCLLNAKAAAQKALQLHQESGRSITVIACGECRTGPPHGEERLEHCMEDFLGAGAILSGLPLRLSGDARDCIAFFLRERNNLARLIGESSSGKELCERGFVADVTHCAQLNASDYIPMLRRGPFITSPPTRR